MNTFETTLKNRAVTSAAWYLRRHDYKILNTDWSCKNGKIDIVAKDDDCLVFVEVPEVIPANKDFPTEKVSAKRRAQLENIALSWLADSDISDLPMRFDKVDIRRIDEDRCMIKHHVNALAQG